MKPENHPAKNRQDHAHSWMIFFATLCGLCGFAVNPVFFDASALVSIRAEKQANERHANPSNWPTPFPPVQKIREKRISQEGTEGHEPGIRNLRASNVDF
jgi:hypothetical protein